MKTIAFDLDDVICWHHSDYDRLGIGKYRHCEPIEAGVTLVNEYYDKGYKSVFWDSITCLHTGKLTNEKK